MPQLQLTIKLKTTYKKPNASNNFVMFPRFPFKHIIKKKNRPFNRIALLKIESEPAKSKLH